MSNDADFSTVTPELGRKREDAPAGEPRVIRAVAPVFPAIAIGANLSASVTVQVQINPLGFISSARAIDGPKILRAAAEAGARHWVFSQSDQATREVSLTFAFKLMPKGTHQNQLWPIFLPPYRVEVREAKDALLMRVDSDPISYAKPNRPRKKDR